MEYDLLTWEGHILRLQFWARAFEILKERGAVYLQTEGKLAGCWVMKIEDEDPAPDQGSVENDDEDREKVMSARTARSPPSAKTSRISSGKSACSGAISVPPIGNRRNGSVLCRPPMAWATLTSAIRPRFANLQRHRCATVVFTEKLLKQR